MTIPGYRFENLPTPTRAVQHTSAGNLPPSLNVATPSIPSLAPIANVTSDQEEEAVERHPTAGAFGPTVGQLVATLSQPSSPDLESPRPSTEGTTAVSSQHNTTFAVSYPPKAQLKNGDALRHPPSGTSDSRSFMDFPPPPPGHSVGPRRLVDRIPSQIPTLTEEYRYDAREGILRPYRSHRCRHCGTVVLNMDHHCPWVGQCVGARNRKYCE